MFSDPAFVIALFRDDDIDGDLNFQFRSFSAATRSRLLLGLRCLILVRRYYFKALSTIS